MPVKNVLSEQQRQRERDAQEEQEVEQENKNDERVDLEEERLQPDREKIDLRPDERDQIQTDDGDRQQYDAGVSGLQIGDARRHFGYDAEEKIKEQDVQDRSEVPCFQHGLRQEKGIPRDLFPVSDSGNERHVNSDGTALRQELRLCQELADETYQDAAQPQRRRPDEECGDIGPQCDPARIPPDVPQNIAVGFKGSEFDDLHSGAETCRRVGRFMAYDARNDQMVIQIPEHGAPAAPDTGTDEDQEQPENKKSPDEKKELPERSGDHAEKVLSHREIPREPMNRYASSSLILSVNSCSVMMPSSFCFFSILMSAK